MLFKSIQSDFRPASCVVGSRVTIILQKPIVSSNSSLQPSHLAGSIDQDRDSIIECWCWHYIQRTHASSKFSSRALAPDLTMSFLLGRGGHGLFFWSTFRFRGLELMSSTSSATATTSSLTIAAVACQCCSNGSTSLIPLLCKYCARVTRVFKKREGRMLVRGHPDWEQQTHHFFLTRLTISMWIHKILVKVLGYCDSKKYVVTCCFVASWSW